MEAFAMIGIVLLTGITCWEWGYLCGKSGVKVDLATPAWTVTSPVTAAEIIERKKSKPFKLHKSSAQLRSEFEAQHNTKEQKHQKLVQEIKQCL